MKHHPRIVVLLLVMFLLAQFLGIAILYTYIDAQKSADTGKTMFKDLPVGERPPLEEKTSYISLMVSILLGTVLLLFLIKYNLQWVWKGWFLLAIVVSLTMAFGAFVRKEVAIVFAVIFGVWKIFRPGFLVQTFTELFAYGGLAVIFVPLLNLTSMSILLVLIGLYDAYAVWKSKHMITMAQSQTKAKVFAGLLLPYHDGKIKVKSETGKVGARGHVKVRMAMLGGGDIGFPLLFAGVVLKEMGLWQSLVIPFFALLGLGYLLYFGDEHKFYPAMPFIGAGCFLGLGVVWLIQFLL